MIPCSVYCRPDEGMHVWLDYEDPNTTVPPCVVGGTYCIEKDTCIPGGSSFKYLGVEDAKEAPIGTGKYTKPVLIHAYVK